MRNLFKIAGLLALTGFISSCNDKETTANYQVIPFTSGNYDCSKPTIYIKW